MPGPSHRTPGVDLEDKTVFNILNSHVPLASCKPGDLFRLPKVAANGLSSSWGVMERHFALLSDIIDQGEGKIVKQRKLHEQLRAWLTHHKMDWAWKHSEQSATWLRCMLQSLLQLKRPGHTVPKNHSKLQILVDKLFLAAKDIQHLVDTPSLAAPLSDIAAAIEPKQEKDDLPDLIDDVTVVELKRKIIDLVCVSDSESEDLEERLFGNKNKHCPTVSKPQITTSTTISTFSCFKSLSTYAAPCISLSMTSPTTSSFLVPVNTPLKPPVHGTLLSAQQLASMAAETPVKPPMPSDYAHLNQVIKGKTRKRLKGKLPEGAHGENAQVADAQAYPAQVGGAAPVYPAQVGGAAQVYPAQVGGAAQVDPVGGAAQVNLAQVGGAQVGYVQAKAKKAPKKPAPASFLLVFTDISIT